ncbi:MAG: hypothetical protein IIX89_05230 [Oscillospiraceae bacterium]|nr:hypothetical protein [Oscillospiraceae bacterium]MBQ5815896.1 hypothetical protein [Oscillospiraceae bacterium]
MIEQDTIKLLRECDAGIKMGVASIEDVIDDVKGEDFKKMLEKSIGHHQKLQDEIQILLSEYHDDGKNPNPIAKGMSYVKTNLKMAVDPSDSTIADLMTDGCNMGIKSLTKYLNEYEAADKKSKDLAKKVIGLEESLAQDMKEYL